MATKRTNNQHIQVFVRCRPTNAQEKKAGAVKAIDVISDRKEIVVRDRFNKTFVFDKVFPPEAKQIDVYQAVMGPTISEVMMGYNCTVFAYGQTGSGKTFTMEGERCDTNLSWAHDPLAGVIPRTLHQMFEELTLQELEFTIKVSFLELYNEELFDLLSATEDTTRLKIYEDSARKGSLIIQGLEEVTVHSREQVFSILQKGAAKRQTAATLLNAHSSRSHTVFTVTVHIRENTDDGEELVKTGKLNLVDLAGSENIGRSGAMDRRAREAGNINQSLLTLGRVITALVDKAPHVESKLTRLLQDSLGGRTKTSIIATISPDMCNLEETLNTLDYAHRAKSITNRPEVNQKMTKRALIKEYTEEIERLRRELVAARDKNGMFVDPENYSAMERRLTCQSENILAKEAQIEDLSQRLADLEELFTSTKEEVAAKTEALQNTLVDLHHTKENLGATKQALFKTAVERDEQQHLVHFHAKTEVLLTETAKTLVDVAKTATGDIDLLQRKLQCKSSIETANRTKQREFREGADALFATIEGNSRSRFESQEQTIESIRGSFAQLDELAKSEQEAMALLTARAKQSHQNAAAAQSSALASILDGVRAAEEQLGTHARSSLASNTGFLVQLFQASVSPLVDGAQRSLQEMGDQCLSLGDKVRGWCRDASARLSQFEKDQAALMNACWEDSAALHKRWQQASQEARQLTASLQQDVHRSSANAEAHVASMQKMLQEYLESVRSCSVDSEARNLQMVEKATECDGIEASLLSVTSRVKDDSASNVQSLLSDWTAIEEGALISTTSSLSEVAASNKELSSIQQRVHQDVSDGVSSLTQSLSQQHSDQEAMRQALVDEVAERASQGAAAADSLLHEADAVVDDLWERVCDHADRAEALCREGGAQADEARATAASLDVETRGNVAEFRGAVTRFFESDLQEYRPTGCTPQRKEYPFPTDLPHTSPHDVILRRLRSAALDMEAAMRLPLPDGGDIEASSWETLASAKSSSTESLTSCSSNNSDEKENKAKQPSRKAKKMTKHPSKKCLAARNVR
ncbi:kinesin-like protein KIF11 [Ixodes scapularis]|uniref:kinesin-like protein KIF11 n=1 Tax=Ixodes scapularis TaxID=6945 RepID=UPI001C382D38|nr:kinesin-like protein KIF11 [Ixodes scapularis]